MSVMSLKHACPDISCQFAGKSLRSLNEKHENT